VPGVEISAQVDRGTMHVLGYWIDPDAEPLQRALRDLREGRAERNRRLLKRLADLRLPVSREEVEARAGCGVVGRPHVAAVMVDRGHVRTRQEAFKRYLGKGRPGYVERYRLSPAESVAVIRAAGGVPVLAHPSTLELQGKALEREVAALREQGLEGIEVYHAEHSPEQVRRYLRLAGRLDLVPSGGSDFHGEANPVLRMGVGFGELCVEDFHLENLRARKGAAANRKTG
jgi:predicted metal-dependent phosphoesterase TrpH